MHHLKTHVLVVGGGTGGTAAALQAARRGVSVILVSEGPWLGGMLTSAGVCVPDGNELAAFQMGIWGQFLRALEQRQGDGLDHSWVSCFCYEPRVGAKIFADWAAALPSLQWIAGQRAIAVELTQHPHPHITAVQFSDYRIEAQIILDGTELGDLLALGNVPHRWGWEPREQWQEPSAPSQVELNGDSFFKQYPVQSPTWVVILQDYGEGVEAPTIANPKFDSRFAPEFDPELAPDFDLETAFGGAWDKYGGEKFLNYGRLPGNRFMLNWPIHGNDYGIGLHRLRQGETEWKYWAAEAIAYSQGFAHYVQQKLGRRYGLAQDMFPISDSFALSGGAYGLQPYYRESRRLQGLATVTELDILPQSGGWTAKLPRNEQGQVTSIAIGNYPNDHHYPTREISLAKKSRRWGGRWTGTPFTIPYGALIPEQVDGLLACDKNISVSHIANGATRLQPTVLGIGQAAGMAAALCVELNCQPRELPVRSLQIALLNDSQAASAMVPFYNVLPEHPDWRSLQLYVLDNPGDYPISGEHPGERKRQGKSVPVLFKHHGRVLQASESDGYQLEHPNYPEGLTLITLRPEVEREMRSLHPGQWISVQGHLNPSGPWIRLEVLNFIPQPSP